MHALVLPEFRYWSRNEVLSYGRKRKPEDPAVLRVRPFPP